MNGLNHPEPRSHEDFPPCMRLPVAPERTFTSIEDENEGNASRGGTLRPSFLSVPSRCHFNQGPSSITVLPSLASVSSSLTKILSYLVESSLRVAGFGTASDQLIAFVALLPASTACDPGLLVNSNR